VEDRTQLWNDFARQIAIDSHPRDDRRRSGHPTSSMSRHTCWPSCSPDHLRFDVKDPDFP
jgi:hypothetical protein